MKRLYVVLTGEAAHAGATPMNNRRDALLAAAKLVVAVSDISRKSPGSFGLPGDQVATVGQISALPNASNVIAGRVELTIDLRDIHADTIVEVERGIRHEADLIATTTGVTIEFTERDFLPPAKSDDTLLTAIDRAAKDLALTTTRLVSHAGHDASIIGQLAPMAMIFVPSVAGISHSPKEFTRDEDCINGANVLLNTIRILSTNNASLR